MAKRRKEREGTAGQSERTGALRPHPRFIGSAGEGVQGSTNETQLQLRQNLRQPTTSPVIEGPSHKCNFCIVLPLFPCPALMNKEATQSLGVRSIRGSWAGEVTCPGIINRLNLGVLWAKFSVQESPAHHASAVAIQPPLNSVTDGELAS